MVVCAESFYNLGSFSFSKPVCIPKGKLSTPLSRLSVITWETLSPKLKRSSWRRVKDEKKPGWEIKEVGAEWECTMMEWGQVKHLARTPQEHTASAVVTMFLMLGGSSCQGAEFGKGLTGPSLNIFPFLTSYIASLSARHNSTVLLRLIKSACQHSPL